MAEKNMELVKGMTLEMLFLLSKPVVGLQGRVGAANYWEMVVWLRPYLFQVTVNLT
jgi:hypothetical protein